MGGSCVSRYKSLYSQLTEADHANLQGLASGKCHFSFTTQGWSYESQTVGTVPFK